MHPHIPPTHKTNIHTKKIKEKRVKYRNKESKKIERMKEGEGRLSDRDDGVRPEANIFSFADM